MNKALRLAAVLSLAGLPALSLASEALIDFELPSLTNGDKVAGAYASTTGVTFTGETDSSAVSGLDSMVPAVNGNLAYLTSTAGSSASFRMEVGGGAFAYDALKLLYIGQLQVTLFDTGGLSESFTLLRGTGWIESTQFSLDPSKFGLIQAIEFTTDASSLLKEFAVDNVQLSLLRSVTPLPTPVPEPASFGLAGLALLGAGAALRRRRRG